MPPKWVPVDRRVLKVDGWPELFQRLWAAGTAPAGGLIHRKYADGLSPRTIQKFREGLGRYFGFLQARGWLDPNLSPAAQVDPDRAGTYILMLQEQGNTPASVICRMAELRFGLKILCPEVDHRWITRPDGCSLESILPKNRKPKEILDPAKMVEWGLGIIEDAENLPPLQRALAYRDGLAIVILACLAPRLGSLMSMDLEHNVFPREDGTWIRFREIDMKNDRRLEYGLPPEIQPYILRYVLVERPILLQGQTHDAFWVAYHGGRLTPVGMQARIRRLSFKRFGKGRGTHIFRHAIATVLPAIVPDCGGMAASILGITARMVDEHYDLGQNFLAAKLHRQALEKERAPGLQMLKRELQAGISRPSK